MDRRTDEVRGRGFTDHVLVCTNDHGSDLACCADVGGRAVFEEVVDWLRERDVLWSPVYVGTCSCLGLCSAEGTAVAIQPRNEWYSEVRPEDVHPLLARELGPDAERLGGKTELSSPPSDPM